MANAIVTQRDTQLERQRAGYIQLSLTNFDNNDEPTIAAGSVVEISGTLYSVTGNESITGWAGMSNGPVWVKLVPSGTDPFTAEYTDVAPTWIDAKQGWYDGTGTDRYVAGLTKTAAAEFSAKHTIVSDPMRVSLNRAASVILSQYLFRTGSGSVTPPNDAQYIVAWGLGGGGAGGGAQAGGTNTSGAGGGGGALSRHVFRVSPSGGDFSYEVGAGGIGANDSNGTAGSTTVLTYEGNSINAYGGGGGGRRDSGTGGAGGSIDGNADLSITGANGANGGSWGVGVGGAAATGKDEFRAGNVGHDLRIGVAAKFPGGDFRAAPSTGDNHGFNGNALSGGGSGGTGGTGGSARRGGHGSAGAVMVEFWGAKN